MRRLSKVFMVLVATVMAASCSTKAVINGTVASAPSDEVIVKLLDINKYEILDTVATDAAGKFNYKVEVAAGQPEFVYVFYKDTKIASLILEAGDNVTVEADTLGRYTVAGSEESIKLAQVEKDFAASLLKLNDLALKVETASEKEAKEISRAMSEEYIRYYRDRVKYIMQNSRSLTVVPVLFQSFSAELPVFAQNTDAIHFRSMADSLELAYPESKYVKALRKEADQRYKYLELQAQIDNAQEVSYVDIELPDVNGKTRQLSEIDSKVVVVQFWNAADQAQKMFNQDIMIPVYEDYHKKGLEIMQVSLDVDKAIWAKAVKDQKLPWISVCDSRGAMSPYVGLYNVQVTPSMFILHEGELVDGQVVDEKSFRQLLNKLLR
jgi:peroxiredoxin